MVKSFTFFTIEYWEINLPFSIHCRPTGPQCTTHIRMIYSTYCRKLLLTFSHFNGDLIVLIYIYLDVALSMLNSGRSSKYLSATIRCS